MLIILRNSVDEPIYVQIVNQIKNAIMSGELQPGELLPSLRGLASDLRISIITTKRAYEELERDGFIETVAGKGCYVKSQNVDFIKEQVMKDTEDLLIKACEKGKLCNLTLDEMKEMLELVYGG